MIFRPGLIAGRLDLLAGDAERRVIRDATFLRRPLEHSAQRVQEIALRERRCGLLVDDALHVLAREQHRPPAACFGAHEWFFAMRLTKVFENVTTSALGLGGACLEWRAVEVRVKGRGSAAMGSTHYAASTITKLSKWLLPSSTPSRYGVVREEFGSN
jgi:hypothetical protein